MEDFEKEAGLIAGVAMLVKIAEGTAEQQRVRIKHLRSAQAKCAAKQSLEFFEGVTYHLKRLQAIDVGRVNKASADARFEEWLKNQDRKDLDIATLRDIFDAMDNEDK